MIFFFYGVDVAVAVIIALTPQWTHLFSKPLSSDSLLTDSIAGLFGDVFFDLPQF